MSDQDGAPRTELDELRSQLQARILAGGPALAGVETDDVWRRIKRVLRSAYDEDLLNTPPHEIHEYVPKPRIEDGKVVIAGGLVDGKKPFARAPEDARIKRDDGAWLHFTLTLKCAGEGKRRDKQVEWLWAYDFELVFPKDHNPGFVRFDLNEPGHANEDREVRSHMHPGNDDLLVPAPVMSPEELLDVLVRRLRPRDGAKPRN